MSDNKIGDMEVWWIRNPPRKGDRFPVKDINEALRLLDTLANSDLKNDSVWANAGGLEIHTENGWEEYANSDGYNIDEIRLQKSEDDLNEENRSDRWMPSLSISTLQNYWL